MSSVALVVSNIKASSLPVIFTCSGASGTVVPIPNLLLVLSHFMAVPVRTSPIKVVLPKTLKANPDTPVVVPTETRELPSSTKKRSVPADKLAEV